MASSTDHGADRSDLKVTLRELAWSVHHRAPVRAGVGPLPTTEMVLLRQVALETPGATVGELATALGLRQPNVSAALRLLVARGLVFKEPSEHDRRVSRIYATPLGESEHAAIADAWTSGLDSAIAALSPEQLETLDNALDALQSLHRSLRRSTDG